MPTKRGAYYYVKRTFRGIGPVYLSLGTKSLARAKALEAMLVTLHDGGRSDVVRAFTDGRVSAQEIAEYHDTSRMHELVEILNAPPPVSLEDACTAALRDKATDVQESTLERYTEGLAHFKRLAPAVVSNALTDDVVRDFRAKRLEEGAAKETVNNDLVAIGILSTYAEGRGWITKRPEAKKFPREPRLSYLDPDQLRGYMAVVRRAFRVQMQLLVGSGMRLKESERLTVGDLRLSDAQALIVDAKSRGARAIFLPAWVVEALRGHIEDESLSGSDRLFTILRRTVQREHARACKLAGIGGYTIHDHRHTAAVALARAGMPIPLLQAQLGHKRIETTMTYAAFNPEYSDVGRYFERVAETFGLAKTGIRGNKIGSTADGGASA